jgi:filamentous hemagglutinin family protein
MVVESTKPSCRRRFSRGAKSWMMLSIAAAAGISASGLAFGGNVSVNRVVAGSATVQQVGNDMIIHAADKTIINYNQFNIAAGTSVQFVQPGATSWVLNRIVTASPSQINGTLTANGIIYLVNPAGVMFGKNSIINVGQLYAAAANISNTDALAGLNHFTAASGSVVNQGTITAGDVYLVGMHVVNGGSILAGSGTVALVAGSDVYLSRSASEPGLMVKISDGTKQGTPSGVGVENDGSIAAQVADMSAGDLYSVAIRHMGQTKAADITLNGAGAVNVSGNLDASNSSGKGGTVEVLGEQVTLSGASVTASGANGGGTIWIGGGPHGSGGVETSDLTLVDTGSSLDANAELRGDGGTVVVWSSSQTVFDGAISVRGGELGGNGGWAEVSSEGLLGFAGSVDAGAPEGSLGTLLLDPHTIAVASGGSASLTDVSSFSNTADETIDAGTIDAANANVVLQANTDIGIDQSIDISTPGVTLTMQAGRSINFASGISITTNNGDVTLSANDNTATASNRDAGPAVINMDASNTISTGSGEISLTIGTLGASGTLTAGNLITTGDVTLTNTAGDVAVVGTVNSGTLTTSGNNFFNFGGPITTTGDININQTGVITIGAALNAEDVNLTSSSANIVMDLASSTVSPVVTTSGDQNYNSPVVLDANTAMTSSGGGDITFNSTVDGAFGLTVNTAGTATFTGLVGGSAPLTSLLIDDTTSGISGGSVDFNAEGTTATPSVVTTAGQTYNEPVLIGADTTFTDKNSGDITFNSTVDGGFNLTINTAGTTTFANQVGQNVQIITLLVDDPASGIVGGPVDCSFAGVATHPTILTSFGQTYNSPIVMLNETAFDDVGGGNIVFNKPINGAFALTLNTTGDMTFNAPVGNTTPVVSVTTDDPATLISGGDMIMNVAGTNAAPSVVTSGGGQTYNTRVTLGADTVLTDQGGGAIAFEDTVDGTFALTVNTAGTTTFAGLVGNSTPLSSLTINDPASGISGGTTTFSATTASPSAPSVVTFGTQTYNNAIVLTADTQLTTEGALVTFNSTINGDGNGPWNFAIDTSTSTGSSGDIRFGNGGADFVGATNELATLTTTANSTDIEGETIFDIAGSGPSNPAVHTSGAQTYNNPVELMADTTLVADGGGSIGFFAPIDGDGNGPWNLTINTSSATAGNIVFGDNSAGYVGAQNALKSVTTTATSSGSTPDGTTLIQMSNTDFAAITTTQGQTYNNPVSLTDETVLVTTGDATGPGFIKFNSTIDGGQDLIIAATYSFTGSGALTDASGGTVTFGGFIGATTPISSLTVSASPVGTGSPGATVFDIVGTTSPSVSATSNLSFATPVTLQTDTKLKSTGGNINFAAAVTGAFNLDLDTSSGGDGILIGDSADVNSVTATAGTSILATNVTTVGDISLQPNSSIVQGPAGAGDNRPGGVIVLGGNLTSTAGDIELAAAGRTSVPTVATIADNPSTANNVTIQALGFTMGPSEKMTVLGNLTINVGSGTAVLGDINTGGSLNVTAGTTVFQLRPSGNILTAEDSLNSEGTTNPPGGTDVVVLGSSLTFNTPAITTTGTGQPVRFATLTGKGNVPGQTIGFYSPNFGTALTDANNTPLDLQAQSFTIETLATSLPGELPPVSWMQEGYGPSGSVDLRTALEIFLGGSIIDNGVARGPAATFVRTVQSMYCLEVGTTGGGEPIYSTEADPKKLKAIHRDLAESLANYSSRSGEEVLNPTFFEAYLSRSKLPADVRTYDRLRELKLATQILGDSGLPPDEQDRVEGAIFAPARVNGISLDDLMQTSMVIGRPRETEKHSFQY